MLNYYRFRQDYLKFEGNDRLDLISRLSTNQVNTLQQFRGIKTVLTNDKGRFVDLLTLYNFGDFVFASCSFDNAKNVIAHLDKYTIMDDFRPSNLAGTQETILLFGDDASVYAASVFGIDIAELMNNDFELFAANDRDSIIARNDDAIEGYMFIYSSKDSEFWQKKILSDELRKKYSMNEIDDVQYDIRRIEYGIPVYPNEMNELTNPLECGLNKYVSFTKGCYIGQEVIARLDTYDKISKHLIRIESETEFKAEESKIMLDGKECGYVTSALNKNGLGFVRTIFLDFGKEYYIKQNRKTINCSIKPINNN